MRECRFPACKSVGRRGICRGYCKRHCERCCVDGCGNAVEYKTGHCSRHGGYVPPPKEVLLCDCGNVVISRKSRKCFKCLRHRDGGVYVYAAIIDYAPIHDCVKIGHSIDPDTRFKHGFAKMMAPYKIIWRRRFDTEIEAAAFEKYARVSIGSPMDGEWVHVSFKCVIDQLNKL